MKPNVRINYGNKVVREFSPWSIKLMRRYFKLKRMSKATLRELTREWAESLPDFTVTVT